MIQWIIAMVVALVSPSQSPAPPLVHGIDHVMVAVRNLPAATDRFRSLGFSLKPGQPHANGITNQHVKFPDGSELELLTAPAAVDEMTTNYLEHLKGGDGPAFAGFFTPDRARLTSRLAALKVTPKSSGALTTFAIGSPLRHLFFGGRNKSPTDLPEHFAHPNGATSLMGVWVATNDPDTRQFLSSLGVTFETVQMDLPMPTRVERGRLSEGEVLVVPAARQTVPGRRIVGVTMVTKDIELVKAALSKAPAAIRDAAIVKGRSVFLPPSITHGIWIELRDYWSIGPPY
jgi:catechol 2,3-dioxygenase-like lactoylglutathione lyase family enzyme